MDDAKQLDRLMREEMPRVERLLVRMLGRRSDLEDLVQNVFLEACRALPSFRKESSLSTFMGGLTVNVARRAMRPSWWQRHQAAWDETSTSPQPDPEHSTLSARQMQHVRRALERISPKKRIAFCLWALEGMDMQEIAELTGASVGATRSRVFHAQTELRAMAERDADLREALGKGDP